MTGRIVNRRTTTALKAIPSAAIAAAAKITAPPSPSPSANSPVAASKAPNMIHSPSAKLIMREDL